MTDLRSMVEPEHENEENEQARSFFKSKKGDKNTENFVYCALIII